MACSSGRFRRATPASPGSCSSSTDSAMTGGGPVPALRWFPELDAAIFTYRRRDDALRAGPAGSPRHVRSPGMRGGGRDGPCPGSPRLPPRPDPAHGPQPGRQRGHPGPGQAGGGGAGTPGRHRLGRGSRSAAGILPNAWCEAPRDRFWHPFLAPLIGELGSRWAAHKGGYSTGRRRISLERWPGARLQTPSLCFLATQDRLGARCRSAGPGRPLRAAGTDRGTDLAPPVLDQVLGPRLLPSDPPRHGTLDRTKRGPAGPRSPEWNLEAIRSSSAASAASLVMPLTSLGDIFSTMGSKILLTSSWSYSISRPVPPTMTLVSVTLPSSLARSPGSRRSPLR